MRRLKIQWRHWQNFWQNLVCPASRKPLRKSKLIWKRWWAPSAPPNEISSLVLHVLLWLQMMCEESDIREMGLPMGPRKKLQGYMKQHKMNAVSHASIVQNGWQGLTSCYYVSRPRNKKRVKQELSGLLYSKQSKRLTLRLMEQPLSKWIGCT